MIFINIALYFDTSHDYSRQNGPTAGSTASFSLKMGSQLKVAALRCFFILVNVRTLSFATIWVYSAKHLTI